MCSQPANYNSETSVIILLITGICFFGACSTSTNGSEEIAHTAIDDTIIKTDTSSFDMDAFLNDAEKNANNNLEDANNNLEDANNNLEEVETCIEGLEIANKLLSDTTKANQPKK